MLISLAEVLISTAADTVGAYLAERFRVPLPVTVRLNVVSQPTYHLSSSPGADKRRHDSKWLI
jgi:phage gp36-like protein